MTEKNKMKQLSKRLMVTAGATTLAATGAVLGTTVVGNGMAASANSIDDQGQSKASRQWTANSVEQVQAAVQAQGAMSIQTYQAQWGDTLNTISAAFGMTPDEAASTLGLQDHGLLVAGQKMDKQAAVIQGLKDAGYLKDGHKTAQADFGHGDQNMIMVQPEADNASEQAAQVENEGQVNSQVSSQNDEQAAQERASQAAEESYKQHLAESQAAVEAAQKKQAEESQAQANQKAADEKAQADAQAKADAEAKQKAAAEKAQADEDMHRMADDNQANVTPTAYTPSQAPQPTPTPAPSQSQATTPSHQGRVDTEALINWFTSRYGKLTYSMSGSRNGADGTADCSGAMVQAMYEAGASKPAWLYNTDSMHSYLQQNGYHLVTVNSPWDAQRGDIVIWGQQGASNGAAGHVQVMLDDANAISVNYWTGGQTGTAVREWNHDSVYNYESKENGAPLAYYVYRQ